MHPRLYWIHIVLYVFGPRGVQDSYASACIRVCHVTRPTSSAPFAPLTSALIASSAFIVPLALSSSSSPSPNHPRIWLWYRSLRKPNFKPKDWVIPVAWFGIEAALANGAYRLLQAEPSPSRTRALGWLAWNVSLIGGWSRLFFKRRVLGVSTVAAASMMVSGAEYVRQARRVDLRAAGAGIPFLAWVSFATVLTGTIWVMNRKR